LHLARHTQEFPKGVVFVRVATAAVDAVDIHLHHVLPHFTRSRLAELDFVLHSCLQRLHVLEHQRECHQTRRHGHRAEHNRAKRDRLQRALLLLALIGFVESLVHRGVGV
jgi:hypothetical protein